MRALACGFGFHRWGYSALTCARAWWSWRWAVRNLSYRRRCLRCGVVETREEAC